MLVPNCSCELNVDGLSAASRALSLDPEVLANASPKLLYRTGLR